MRILVADDELKIRRVISLLLKDEGYEVVAVENGMEAIDEMQKFSPDLILLDQQMHGMTGIETLKKIKEINPAQVVLIITAYGSISMAVSAIKEGAYDFIEKPFDNDKLLLTVERALEYKKLTGELDHLKTQLNENYSFGQIIGNSNKLQNVMGQVKKVASTAATVLILGESGVGKELIAHAVHNHSSRSNKAFVAVNCGAIPLTLIESELFGHEKGAFTDAKEKRTGSFEQANGGTLFLDEIGELPIDAQVKLLRVLEERTITRLGGKKPIPVDVRIIAATNRNLEEKVRQGTFRLDLLYRLNIFAINIPALRERKEDIPQLVDFFIDKYNKILGLNVKNISREAINKLKIYDWPGNVRDLENAIQSAMILSQNNTIEIDDLPMRLKGYPTSLESALLNDAEIGGIKDVSAKMEKEIIEETLKKFDYNRSLTANTLNISRKTLFNKMKKYGIK